MPGSTSDGLGTPRSSHDGETGLGLRETGLGLRETGLGLRETVLGLRESGRPGRRPIASGSLGVPARFPASDASDRPRVPPALRD